jgi:hypothetical protein
MMGVVGAATTIACSTPNDAGASADDEIHARPTQAATTVLSSTYLLASGCTAAKVGRRHLLVAARCVVGHDEIAAGQALDLEIAKGRTATLREQEDDSDAGVSEDAGSANDAGDAAKATGPTIEKVAVNEAYASMCAGDKCAFGSLAASEAKDVAVIILKSDLDKSVPTIPVDLDSVRAGDTLMAVGGGCRTLDAPPRRERLTRTLAVPAKAATHRGSVYEKSPALISRLDQSYVVTPGRGWRAGDPGLCRTDIGAPLFRSGGKLAVAGITAGFTFAQADDPLPVTLQHTRVDTASEVGPWLESLGVETIHSCSGSGCVKTTVSDDVPTVAQMDIARKAPDTDNSDDDSDAGLVAPDAGDAGPTVMEGNDVELGEDTHDGYSSSDPTYADAGKPKKKTVVTTCSSTPGPIGGSPFAFAALGVALVSLARRRGAPRRG